MTSPPLKSVGVVGAGIIGLAVARELTIRFPGIAVTVLEKEDHVAAHQSGHNSGVVHAGIYYRPGSMKATLCLRGGAMLREFCQQHDVPLRELGKLIVATSEHELAGLDELEKRAIANQVPGIRRLDGEQIAEIEPFTRGVAALHSPHTAVVDYIGMCEALAREVTAAGGSVLLETPVTSVELVAGGAGRGGRGRRSAGRSRSGSGGSDGGRSGSGLSAGGLSAGGLSAGRRGGVRVWSAEVARTFDYLIVCAGLTGDDLARQLGQEGDLRIIPFRGEYYELAPAAQPRVRGLVYPVPDPAYPFLGVHLTRDVRDNVHVGPNAVLALAFQGYRWRDVNAADVTRIASWPGSWRLAGQHWRSGANEIAGSLSKRRYLARVRAYQPDLQLDDLVRSTSGVRAQAIRRDGSLVDDFALQAEGNVLLVRNAPSPAATASLAIAEHIVSSISAS